MRFIQHHPRILKHQPGLKATPVPPDTAVTREQHPAPNHIHRAHDNRRPRRVEVPSVIVRKFSAQCRNRDARSNRHRSRLHERRHQRAKHRASFSFARVLKPRLQLLHFLRRLIHNHPPIHNINQPPRNLPMLGRVRKCRPERRNPDSDHTRLPQPCRHIAVPRQITSRKPQKEFLLPRKRFVVREG